MREQRRHNRFDYDATVLSSSSRKASGSFWIIPTVLALIFLLGQPASASQLTLIFSTDPGGISLAGSGTSAATVNFGSVQAYGGTVPSGVTKSINGTSWTLSTAVDVQVSVTGCGNCTGYTMTAQLQAADLMHTWQFGGATVTSAFPATVTTAGVFGTKTAYTFALTIPFAAPAGAVNNTLDIVVTSN